MKFYGVNMAKTPWQMPGWGQILKGQVTWNVRDVFLRHSVDYFTVISKLLPDTNDSIQMLNTSCPIFCTIGRKLFSYQKFPKQVKSRVGWTVGTVPCTICHWYVPYSVFWPFNAILAVGTGACDAPESSGVWVRIIITGLCSARCPCCHILRDQRHDVSSIHVCQRRAISANDVVVWHLHGPWSSAFLHQRPLCCTTPTVIYARLDINHINHPTAVCHLALKTRKILYPKQKSESKADHLLTHYQCWCTNQSSALMPTSTSQLLSSVTFSYMQNAHWAKQIWPITGPMSTNHSWQQLIL